MSYKKGESRVDEILKQLEAVTQGGHEQQGGMAGLQSVGEVAAGDAVNPDSAARSAWPASGGPPLYGKGSTRLFSWRSDGRVQDAIAKVALYMRGQRDQYYPEAAPLSDHWMRAFSGFYSPSLLSRVRIKELKDRRVENPWFYDEAKASGVTNLPNMAHRAVVTFLDVVVFNEKITARHLFHGLVHTAQVKLLGAERYAELFVAGFLQARSYFLVPLKAHAFALDTRYAEDPEARFSVEEEVSRWAAQDRY